MSLQDGLGEVAWTPAQKITIKSHLRRAVKDCSDHGLFLAAKWAAELVSGLGGVPGDQGAVAPPLDEKVDPEEMDRVCMAKSMFDLKEYRRCAHLLQDHKNNNRALFLWGYSLFLAGEKRKEEEAMELAETPGRTEGVNKELGTVFTALSEAHANGTLNGFGLYLHAVVLRKLDHTDQAREVLFESVKTYPWNWSAWLALAELCNHERVLAQQLLVDASANYMRHFFLAHLFLDLQRNEESAKFYLGLTQCFPQSNHLLAQSAMVKYSMREFDEAQKMFELLLKRDPFRLENLETYSNILYVKEQTASLSYLAHSASQNDKYRPETCCIIGNYYSLKAEHERAVLYFKRALKLNRHYLSAWTLMGHEYVELKNPSAAIEAYRRAVDINPRDYRAWYGLGQTYEILQMWYYSLFYYRKATSLRPYDARMWCAMGGCYEQLGRKQDAIKCYQRADSYDDPEGISLSKLAKLYHEMGNDERAADYYKKNLHRRALEQSEGPDKVEALLFLANHFRNINCLTEAEKYCTQLLDYPGPEKEQAKALLREIRSVHLHSMVRS